MRRSVKPLTLRRPGMTALLAGATLTLLLVLLPLQWITLAQLGGFAIRLPYPALLIALMLAMSFPAFRAGFLQMARRSQVWLVPIMFYLLIVTLVLQGSPGQGSPARQFFFAWGCMAVGGAILVLGNPRPALRIAGLACLIDFPIATEIIGRMIGTSWVDAVRAFLSGDLAFVIYGFLRNIYNFFGEDSAAMVVASEKNAISASLLVGLILFRAAGPRHQTDHRACLAAHDLAYHPQSLGRTSAAAPGMGGDAAGIAIGAGLADRRFRPSRYCGTGGNRLSLCPRIRRCHDETTIDQDSFRINAMPGQIVMKPCLERQSSAGSKRRCMIHKPDRVLIQQQARNHHGLLMGVRHMDRVFAQIEHCPDPFLDRNRIAPIIMIDHHPQGAHTGKATGPFGLNPSQPIRCLTQPCFTFVNLAQKVQRAIRVQMHPFAINKRAEDILNLGIAVGRRRPNQRNPDILGHLDMFQRRGIQQVICHAPTTEVTVIKAERRQTGFNAHQFSTRQQRRGRPVTAIHHAAIPRQRHKAFPRIEPIFAKRGQNLCKALMKKRNSGLFGIARLAHIAQRKSMNMRIIKHARKIRLIRAKAFGVVKLDREVKTVPAKRRHKDAKRKLILRRVQPINQKRIQPPGQLVAVCKPSLRCGNKTCFSKVPLCLHANLYRSAMAATSSII